MNAQHASVAIGSVIGITVGISSVSIITAVISAVIGTLIHYYGIRLLDYIHKKFKKE